MKNSARILSSAILAGLTVAQPASASCDDRPGTPNQVTAEQVSRTTIRMKWRNTTRGPRQVWFDIYFRDADGRDIGRDITGGATRTVTYGEFSTFDFNDIVPGRRYCMSLRARTGPGTQGCISLLASNTACITTSFTGPAQPPPSQPRPPAPAAPAKPAPVPRQCSFMADVTVYQCTNLDGTRSEYFTEAQTSGCGATEDEALFAAKLAFGGMLGDDPGTCQYRHQIRRQACACAFPAPPTVTRSAELNACAAYERAMAARSHPQILAVLKHGCDQRSAPGFMTFFGLADYDRDGHRDLLAVNSRTGDLMLYPGESKRAYSQAQPVKIGNGWKGYSAFGVADWDRDGHQDIVTRQDSSGDLFLYPGESTRAYSNQQPVKIGNGWNDTTFMGIGDWDRDGYPDLVVRRNSTGELLLFPGQGVRGYSQHQPVVIGTGWRGYSPRGIADYDGDGHLDILTVASNGDLMLYPGESKRAMSNASPVKIAGDWTNNSFFGVGDWDGDGRADIISRRSGLLFLHPGPGRRSPLASTPIQIGNGW